MKPTISVLITYCDEQDLLKECIESLLNSEEKPEEILIYDDASRYPAYDYIPSGINVKILRSDSNQGTSYGRNLLLDISQGDYIHFHDADDLFTQHWCKRLKQAIKDSNADVILTEVSTFAGAKLVSPRLLGLKRLLSGEDFIRFCLQSAILPIATTIRREVAKEVRYSQSLCQSEDFYYHICLAARGVSFNVIDEPLVFKRNRTPSQSQNSIDVWTAVIKIINLLTNKLPIKYRPDLAELAVEAGSVLFKLGALSKAREVFRLSYKLGPATFRRQRRLYRLTAQTFGPEFAERIGIIYRRIIPQILRGYLAERGW